MRFAAQSLMTARAMEEIDPGHESTKAAQAHSKTVRSQLTPQAEYTMQAEIAAPVYGTTASWKSRLLRKDISISEVEGQIDSIWMMCENGRWAAPYPEKTAWQIPPGLGDCSVRVQGSQGTSFKLNELPVNAASNL